MIESKRKKEELTMPSVIAKTEQVRTEQQMLAQQKKKGLVGKNLFPKKRRF